ncbi:MAG: 4-deoxy-4-formamido-L-arabinose-phosphoundecaprenol deformylase [bacterium]|nr:4-deoxy-4-formamido-L-arabinose-phosphoundecaprenol deformylase [bacterium]
MKENIDSLTQKETILGLKIDVDTFRGTKIGVPALSNLLYQKNIRASFFFSIGPDNMGRHIWRILKPQFLKKMMRGNAAKLYGLDILFKGFLWPGPDIGIKLAKVLQSTVYHNHEIALHAYDHYKWQTYISKMDENSIKSALDKAIARWKEIFGASPAAAGNPGWQLSKEWLDYADTLNFSYRSDCRGVDAGYPELDGEKYKTLQIPTTLPTYDEVIGRNGVNESNYNEYIMSLIEPGKLNVLTIHSEVEGISCFNQFRKFTEKCFDRNIKIVPLCDIYNNIKDTKNILNIEFKEIPGREGNLAVARKK